MDDPFKGLFERLIYVLAKKDLEGFTRLKNEMVIQQRYLIVADLRTIAREIFPEEYPPTV